jgi:hypothetical protein
LTRRNFLYQISNLKTEIDPLKRIYSTRPLSELDKKAVDMLHPEIQKARRIVNQLEPNFIHDSKMNPSVGLGLVQSDDLGYGRRKESQKEFDYMAKGA